MQFFDALGYGDSLKLEDLVLVTACERTCAWATAWSERRSDSLAMSLQFHPSLATDMPWKGDPDVVLDLSAFTAGSVQWINNRGIDANSGPLLRELLTPLPPSDDIRNCEFWPYDISDLPYARLPGGSPRRLFQPEPTPANQLVSVKGFRANTVIKEPIGVKAGGTPREDAGMVRSTNLRIACLVLISAHQDSSLLAFVLQVVAEVRQFTLLLVFYVLNWQRSAISRFAPMAY